MLHRAVGVEKTGADRADLGARRMLDQQIHPVWLCHLDIVVQEQQKLALRFPDPEIADAGEIERPIRVDDLHPWIVC